MVISRLFNFSFIEFIGRLMNTEITSATRMRIAKNQTPKETIYWLHIFGIKYEDISRINHNAP